MGTKKKNPAAVALGKQRWAGIDQKTRSEIMTRTIRARWAKKGAK